MTSLLLITSNKLKNLMEKEVEKFRQKYEITVVGIDTEIAAFIKVKDVIDVLKFKKDYDFVIVPGNFVGNCKVIEEYANVKKVIRGTKNLSDLKILLENLEKLSKEELEKLHFYPADDILTEKINENLKKELEELNIVDKNLKFFIKSIPINGIPKIVGEIANAPLLDDEEIKRKTKKFVEDGCSIISIGMINEEKTDEIKRIVKCIKEITNLPICLDSINENEILNGVKNSIDMIMSLNFENYTVAKDIKIPVVITPTDKKGLKKHNERIFFLEKLIEKIKTLNEDIKIIVDPILDPINFGFTDSLNLYYQFRKKYPNIAMFMGVGNVTELVDVDSHGVNALLAFIAYELNIDLLYTPEHSVKAMGSVKELSTAIKMMFLANKRNCPPVNIGINMLILKDKRKENLKIDEFIKNFNGNFVDLSKVEYKGKYDDVHFKIFVTDKIYVIENHKNKDIVCFYGNKAEYIYKGILKHLKENNINISNEHCCYLGRELNKAEIGLKLGKQYIQDMDLFRNWL